MEPSIPPSKSSPAVPIAIVVGFAMIALAIFFTNSGANKPDATANDLDENNLTAVNTAAPRPVSEKDYIRGNPNAPILMVEYSDYDCPFCGRYHTTMNQIMDEYGVTGRIAWVYRQFPIAELHPNSPKISEAALCVGDLGGNDAFWKFTDKIFSERDVNVQTNVTKLPEYAEIAGVNKEEYIECMNSTRMQQEVTNQITDGYNSGARGTPYTVLIVGNQQAIISGAQPYDVVKGIVSNLVDQMDGMIDTKNTETPKVKMNDVGVPIIE